MQQVCYTFTTPLWKQLGATLPSLSRMMDDGVHVYALLLAGANNQLINVNGDTALQRAEVKGQTDHL